MGTSQSSPGPNGSSPLIPPWADDEPGLPSPEPQPRRHIGFRTDIGKYANTRDSSYLKRALKKYSGSSSGGGAVASRRLGAITKAGSQLYGMLSGEPGTSSTGLDLRQLDGIPCEQAVSAIANSLSDGADADKIRVAVNHALTEALVSHEAFDSSNFTPELLSEVMVCYLTESIFIQVLHDAGDSWKKFETVTQAIEAENDLRQLIKIIVNSKLTSYLGGYNKYLTRNEVIDLERNVIQETWNEWEQYND